MVKQRTNLQDLRAMQAASSAVLSARLAASAKTAFHLQLRMNMHGAGVLSFLLVSALHGHSLGSLTWKSCSAVLASTSVLLCARLAANAETAYHLQPNMNTHEARVLNFLLVSTLHDNSQGSLTWNSCSAVRASTIES